MTVQTLRSESAGLTRLASRDLARLWRLVADGASAETALRDLLPAIVTTYGEAGAAMAADWYDDLRAKAGAAGVFTAFPLEADDRGTQALIGWALSEATDDASLKTLIEGGTQRRIVDHVRGTIAQSAAADPKAAGWKRIGAGACAFCRMLIERDTLYTEATADFASHDNCNCQAYPLIQGAEPIDVKSYVQTTRKISDADRARVREWLRTH